MEEMLLFGWMSRFAEAECIDSTTPGVTTKIFFARHGKKYYYRSFKLEVTSAGFPCESLAREKAVLLEELRY